MATIKLSRAQNANAALAYAEGKNQLKTADRHWLKNQGVDPQIIDQLHDRAVVMGGHLVDPAFAAPQMAQVRHLFQNTGKTQAMRVIQSFSDQDLHASDPRDWQRANDLGVALAQKMAPDYQAAVYTHLDGTGHKLHNHIIINMPNLRTGKKYHHTNDFVRVAHLNDQVCQAAGLSVLNQQRERQPIRRTLPERKMAAKGAYVWKDDLRHRIDQAVQLTATAPFSSLAAQLTPLGVSARLRGQTISYAFLDAHNKQRRIRGKTLGAAYDRVGLTRRLQQHAQQWQTDCHALQQTLDTVLATQRPTSWTALQQQLKSQHITLHLTAQQQLHYVLRHPQTHTASHFRATDLGGPFNEFTTLNTAIQDNARVLAGHLKQARQAAEHPSPRQRAIEVLTRSSAARLRTQTTADRQSAKITADLRARLQDLSQAVHASQRRFERTLPHAEFHQTQVAYQQKRQHPTRAIHFRPHAPLLINTQSFLWYLIRQQQAQEARRQAALRREQAEREAYYRNQARGPEL